MKLHLSFHRDVTPAEVTEAKAGVTPAERAAAAAAFLAAGVKRCPETTPHPHPASASPAMPTSCSEFPPLDGSDSPVLGHRRKAPVGWSAWFPSPTCEPSGPPAPTTQALDRRTVLSWTSSEVQAWLGRVIASLAGVTTMPNLTGAELLSLSEARLCDSLFELGKGDARKVLEAILALRASARRT